MAVTRKRGQNPAYRPADIFFQAGPTEDSAAAAPPAVVSAERRPIGLLVDELADAFLAAVVVEAVGRLLGANEIIFSVVVGHFADPPDRVLRSLEGGRALLHQRRGD